MNIEQCHAAADPQITFIVFNRFQMCICFSNLLTTWQLHTLIARRKYQHEVSSTVCLAKQKELFCSRETVRLVESRDLPTSYVTGDSELSRLCNCCCQNHQCTIQNEPIPLQCRGLWIACRHPSAPSAASIHWRTFGLLARHHTVSDVCQLWSQFGYHQVCRLFPAEKTSTYYRTATDVQ